MYESKAYSNKFSKELAKQLSLLKNIHSYTQLDRGTCQTDIWTKYSVGVNSQINIWRVKDKRARDKRAKVIRAKRIKEAQRDKSAKDKRTNT